MKKLLLITLLLINITAAFCQGGYIKTGSIGTAKPQQAEKKEDKFLYGPVKFRELSETVGEKYLVLPLDKNDKKYSFIYKGDKAISDFKLLADEGFGKTLTLTGIDNEIAHFKDSLNNFFSAEIVDGHIYDIVPLYDIDEARKLFLNKTLWMNQDHLKINDAKTNEITWIKQKRFEPVTVIEIVSGNSAAPVRFIVKTLSGEVAYTDVVVSGTNMFVRFLLPNMFENVFFTKDPKLTYKFTAATWAKIKQGITEIGMTEDMVRLSRGRPDKINRSSGPGSSNQWVYSTAYLYFSNGKLTTIHNK